MTSIQNEINNEFFNVTATLNQIIKLPVQAIDSETCWIIYMHVLFCAITGYERI